MRFAFFIFALFLLPAFSLQKTNDKIYWADKKLSWDDFRGKKQISYFKAFTFTELGYKLSMDNDSVTIEISCHFNPNLSWTIADTSDYLLNHEQRHFDIAEYTCRKFKQAVLEYQFSKKQLLQKEINNLYTQHMSLNRSIQTTYDAVSNHSLNRSMQEIWDTRIDSMITETQKITQNRIVIDISGLK